jgi:hypothetical protein
VTIATGYAINLWEMPETELEFEAFADSHEYSANYGNRAQMPYN